MSNQSEMDQEDSESERLKNVFSNLRHDFKAAKDAKNEIDELITDWNDLYYGVKRDKNGTLTMDKTNRSKFSMKEIAKQIEWQKPNITEPFTSTRTPIHISDPKSQSRAKNIEKWANHEFTTIFDREEFMDQVADVVLREGTVWVQSSWETKEENERTILPRVTMEELMQKTYDPDDIEQNSDGTYKVEYNKVSMTENNPDAKVMRNEHVFPDPAARTEDELRFICVRKLLTIPDLRRISIIPSEKIDTLESRVTSETREDTSLGLSRDIDAASYGYDDSYEPKDTPRKHIKIVEYWGYYDLDDDGLPEPIIGYFAEDYNIDLVVEENPMPDKALPFDRAVYSARPFSLWGNAAAFFIGDHQKAKNGMMRGIMDNMSLANNNQKFVTRGALDYVNFKRMTNGGRYIVVNKPDSIEDGQYNNIPPAVFTTMQMISEESKDLMGVNSGGPALSTSNVAKDGQQAQLTMSQQRMAALVRNLSNMLRKIIGKWITMGEVFLTDAQIFELFTEQDMVDMNAFSISKKAKVSVSVATEVNRNMKLQQYNMLMQQSKVLEQELPPGTLKEMVAEMYDLFDMHEQASELRAYNPEPSEEEKMAQQLQLQNAQLENQKLQMEIGVMQKDVEARYMNAQARVAEANANVEYKGAQSHEKMTKAQGHQIDSAMKPVEVENELMKTQQSNNKE